MAGDSKTEKATPKRRRDERKKGNVLMSKDAVAVATLIGSLLMVQLMGGVFVERISDLMNLCFNYMSAGSLEMVAGLVPELFKNAILIFLVLCGPF